MSDKILQINCYKNMLIEQYETRPVDREEVYATCGLLDRVKTLKSTGLVSYYTIFMFLKQSIRRILSDIFLSNTRLD